MLSVPPATALRFVMLLPEPVKRSVVLPTSTNFSASIAVPLTVRVL